MANQSKLQRKPKKKEWTQSQRKAKLAKLKLQPDKGFWGNTNFILAIDALAKRYGMLPTEVLQMSPHDFSFNICVMYKVTAWENEQRESAEKKYKGKNKDHPPMKTWGGLGIGYEVK